MNGPETEPNSDPPIQPRSKTGATAVGAEKTTPNGRDPAVQHVDSAFAAALLGDLKREMNRLQREIRLAIQAQLGQMAGRSLGTIEANRELTQSIQEMLEAHGLRVRCSQCGNAAILRVSPRAGAAAGVFVFDHTIEGRRTFHGGWVAMPEIRLVSKPARKSRGEQKAG